MAGKRILIICTSHGKLGDTDKATGLWAEELAAPYYIFTEAGLYVDVASIQGGKIPIDPDSLQGDLSEHTSRFLSDESFKCLVENSIPLASVSDNYDTVFLPGGHGVCYDFPEHSGLISLLEKFWAQGKVLAAVCHGPVGLVNIKSPNGDYVVKGKKVTGFSNTEEQAVGRCEVVPFLLEDRLKEIGGLYEKGSDWAPYAIADGKLITGQNPQSAVKLAELVLAAL